MKLKVKTYLNDAAKTFVVEVEPEIHIADLKLLIEAETFVPPKSQALFYKRKQISDQKSLSEYPIKSGESVYLCDLRSRADTTRRSEKSKNDVKNAKNERNIPLDFKALNNPTDMVQNFLGKDAQFKSVCESHPEIGQMFTDKNLMKENLEIASNPALANEILKTKDRVIQNISNHPEGFNILQRMYKSVEEPLTNVLLDKLGFGKKFKNREQNVTSAAPFPAAEPLGDPWAAPQPSPVFGNLAQSPKINTGNQRSNIVIDPNVLYSSQLSQLQSMGFHDRQSNIRALIRTNGNVEAAVNLLLS